jgi:hypothetical protein
VNQLVKLLTHDDGDPADNDDWHLSVVRAGSTALLCTGEFYGYGEGGATAETKSVLKGGITCPDCLRDIREIKAVRL